MVAALGNEKHVKQPNLKKKTEVILFFVMMSWILY